MPQSLNLWNQNLGRVPGDVFQQTQLTTLILAGNALTELPPEINGLQNLRTLDLGHNLLTDLPPELGDIRSLTDFLYLHDNRLVRTPGLPRLPRLSLAFTSAPLSSAP